MLKRMDSKHDSEKCSYEGNSIKNNKQNESDKTNNKIILGFSLLNVLETCNFTCNLGASINLMPLSMMRKLNSGKPKPTQMTLTLVDLLITYPYSV